MHKICIIFQLCFCFLNITPTRLHTTIQAILKSFVVRLARRALPGAERKLKLTFSWSLLVAVERGWIPRGAAEERTEDLAYRLRYLAATSYRPEVEPAAPPT